MMSSNLHKSIKAIGNLAHQHQVIPSRNSYHFLPNKSLLRAPVRFSVQNRKVHSINLYRSISLSHYRNGASVQTSLLPTGLAGKSSTLHGSGIVSSPLPDLVDQACKGVGDYEELHQFSIKEPDSFWGSYADSKLEWMERYSAVKSYDTQAEVHRWFEGGKLNAAVNCVDRHAAKTPDKVALLWERDEPGKQQNVTYKELLEMVSRMANTLLNHGVTKGDRVAIYLPVSPIGVVAMLACARIGAIHSVVFAGFSAQALASRINDADAKVVITSDKAVRGGRTIDLLSTTREAVKQCDNLKGVFVAKLLDDEVELKDGEINLNEEMSKSSATNTPAVMDSEDILFLLYTSGSTGSPKGIAHSTAGYLLYAAVTHELVFDVQPGDIFGCVADIGWITGHSYVVYGPLMNGATTVLFESTPVYPDPGRYWETVQRLGITQFYGAPTALRLLIKYGDEHVQKYDRSSLRTLGSVGEPINVDAWKWYNDVVGEDRCTVVDTWWQTETGGIMLSPRPSQVGAAIKEAMPMRPMLGIQPILKDSEGNTVEGNDVGGALCIESNWPGMARTIYGNHQRFLETYYKPFPGCYFTGDGGHRDIDGFFSITGRMDDVINVTGHRLGTAEVEDVMMKHPDVSETAVVGFPHDIKGEGVCAYVILKENVTTSEMEITAELKASVKKGIAGYAVPEVLLFVPGLPKTRSGKIMRRLLRVIAKGEDSNFGDISTLADPSVVNSIVQQFREHSN